MELEPGALYECTASGDGGLMGRETHKGEIWRVEKIDSDGDVHAVVVHSVGCSDNATGHTTFFSPSDFAQHFSPAGRSALARALAEQIKQQESALEFSAEALERSRAKLMLMRICETDEAEARAIWNAIQTHGKDIGLVAQALGLADLLDGERVHDA